MARIENSKPSVNGAGAAGDLFAYIWRHSRREQIIVPVIVLLYRQRL